MTQVYNQNSLLGWDSKTNIERFMESVTKYCDGLVVFDDGSTDGSRDVVTEWSGSIELEIPSNKENTPKQECFHRARSLEHCKRLGADWVLCLDPDEVFEKKAECGALRALCEQLDSQYDSVEFPMRDLWRTDRFVRLDGRWSKSTGPRLFRLGKNLSYDIAPAFRDSLVPNGITSTAKSALKVVHFGYAKDDAIISKYKRFKSLGVDLLSHLNDANIRLCDIGKWLHSPPGGPGIEVYDKQICEILP
jgi:glycosyltransferase involved in cell wall biosynthesis